MPCGDKFGIGETDSHHGMAMVGGILYCCTPNGEGAMLDIAGEQSTASALFA